MLTASWRPYWGGLVPGTRPSFLPSMSSSSAELLLLALLLQPGEWWLIPEVATSVLLGGRGGRFSFFSYLVNFIPNGSVCQVLSVLVRISPCVCVCVSAVLSHVPALCDLMDCSLSGSSVHGIFQATILEWVAYFLLQGNSRTQGSNLHPLQSPALARGFFTIAQPG